MGVIEKIADNVWKLNASSNVYFLDFDEKIIIDAGKRADRSHIEMFLGKVVDFDLIEKVIFTHMHYDHVGNFDLFKRAKFYAGASEIYSFKRRPTDTVADKDMAQKLIDAKIELNPLKDGDNVCGLKVIETPGHTSGSICLWHEKDKILFSGDTIFAKGILGRTDLPTSNASAMKNTMMKMIRYNYKILCPGHNY